MPQLPTAEYVTIGKLARGGMGEVDLGMRRTGTFERLVAIKRLRAEFLDDADIRHMFLEEARMAGMIRHPNVVSVLDVGDDDRGPFLIMEFIEGISVSRLLTKLHGDGSLLPLQVVARIVAQVAQALTAAHELRHPDGSEITLVHRDVSPQNILLGFDGVVRLTDFGIAKALGVSRETTAGLLKGKAGYMSPEQLRFEGVDAKSDLFSLGVVLFELASARRLYGGKERVSVARRILDEPAPDLYTSRGDAPQEMVELCFEMLAKTPSLRPESARSVSQTLGNLVDRMAADYGPLHVGAYLREHFSDELEESRSRVAALIKAENAPRDTAEEPSEAPPTGRRQRATRAALFAAAMGIAATGAWALSTGDDQEVDDLTSVSDASPQETAEEPASLEPATPATTEIAPMTEPSVVEEPPESTAMAARRRRTRRRRPTMEAMGAENMDFRALELIRGMR